MIKKKAQFCIKCPLRASLPEALESFYLLLVVGQTAWIRGDVAPVKQSHVSEWL